MHNLLQPGGAAFGEGRNEEVGGLGLVAHTVLGAFPDQGQPSLLGSLEPLGDRGGAGDGRCRAHGIFSL